MPAADNAEIGGDFYEVIELDADRLLVAIGDVAGHSIHAATVMVELRHALRAYAIEGTARRSSSRLERMLRATTADEYATLCLLLLDVPRHERRSPTPATCRRCSSTPTGRDYLDVYGPMLGLGRHARPGHGHAAPATGHHRAGHRRPGRDARGLIDTGMERLRRRGSRRRARGPLRRPARPVRTGRVDDIALLVLRWTG